jgi:3-hexulose-6-phosphate synthase
MKLIISFDITDLQSALTIAKQVAPFCDIIEIGTILFYKYGVEAINEFKKALPATPLLADSKIIDRGRSVADVLAQAGAEWMTVMAGTSNSVIHAVCSAAHSKNSKVVLDLLDAPSLGQSAMEAQNLGVDALLFHPPHDENNGRIFLDQWDMVSGNTRLPLFVSAKINRDNVNEVMKIKPAAMIIGTSIVTAANPAKEAEYFYKLINE